MNLDQLIKSLTDLKTLVSGDIETNITRVDLKISYSNDHVDTVMHFGTRAPERKAQYFVDTVQRPSEYGG